MFCYIYIWNVKVPFLFFLSHSIGSEDITWGHFAFASCLRGNVKATVKTAGFPWLRGFSLHNLQVDQDHDRRMDIKEFTWCMSMCGLKLSQPKLEAWYASFFPLCLAKVSFCFSLYLRKLAIEKKFVG